MGKICNTEKTQSRRQCPTASHAKAARSRWSPHYKQIKHSEQQENAPNRPRLFACPFAKHDPSAVPRSCFLGWHSISRVKEHLSRRHKPSSDLNLHCKEAAISNPCSCGSSKCAACKMEGLRLNEAATQMVRSRSPDCAETWTQIYCTIYPHATDIPSPFIEHHEPSHKTAEHVIREFSQVLCEGLDDVLRSTGRNYDGDLARQLQDYVLSQGRRYIESEQHEEPESSSTEWATSELASSKRCLENTTSGGPAPLLGVSVGDSQDSFVMPTHDSLLGDVLEISSEWDNWKYWDGQSSSLLMDGWIIPSTSSLLSNSEPSTILDIPELVSSENTSPNSSVQTIKQFPDMPMLMDLNPNSYPCSTSLDISRNDSSSLIIEARMEQQSNVNFEPWTPYRRTTTATECY